MKKYNVIIPIILLVLVFAILLYLSERNPNLSDISANSDTCTIIDNLYLSENARIEDLPSDIELESDYEYLSINLSVI